MNSDAFAITEQSLLDGDTFMSMKQSYKRLSLREEEDKIIKDIINEIWTTYNEDNDSVLDKKEMAEFIFITLI